MKLIKLRSTSSEGVRGQFVLVNPAQIIRVYANSKARGSHISLNEMGRVITVDDTLDEIFALVNGAK